MYEHAYAGWKKKVVDLDNRVPFILIGVLLGLLSYTVGEQMHWHWPHVLHSESVHKFSNEWLMMIFFGYLGLEISLSQVQKAGKFVACATIGGMVFPPLLCWVLTRNVYVALGAAATDVAFSLGAAKLITRGDARVLKLLVVALLLLAIGDDLGGIALMAAVYAASVSVAWLFVELGVFIFTYFCGEKGVIDVKFQEKGKPDTLKHIEIDVEAKSPSLWVALAFANTVVLAMAGIEWVLGPCLAFIMAPPSVNHRLGHLLKPFIPLVLLVFGTVNGAIDILNSDMWGLLTAGCFFGGMLGKQIGVFSGGLIGRKICEKSDPDDQYAKMPLSQLYGLALFASVNGTVAIYFVTTAFKNGKIDDLQAAQATLGYFLTVPAVYVQTLIVKALGIIQDTPAFQPEEEEQETLTHDVPQETVMV